MEKQLPDRYLTVVFDTAGWSDAQLAEITHRDDARSLSWSHAINERNTIRKENDVLKEEIKRLVWASQEQD